MTRILLDNSLVKNDMTTNDLVTGKQYRFPYSQIVWTYIGGTQFYSPEWDTYKEVTLTHFQCVSASNLVT